MGDKFTMQIGQGKLTISFCKKLEEKAPKRVKKNTILSAL